MNRRCRAALGVREGVRRGSEILKQERAYLRGSANFGRNGYACCSNPAIGFTAPLSGKTLVASAGFIRPSSGVIRMGTRRIVDAGPDRVVVFQDVANALFPWIRTDENVAFGLSIRGVSPTGGDHEQAITEAVGSGVLAFCEIFQDLLSFHRKDATA